MIRFVPAHQHASTPAMVTPSQGQNGMSGIFADQVRSAGRKAWSDRIDLNGLARVLRARHPEKTAVHVAAETGLPHDSVRKWLSGESVPGGKALLALICAYGPDLMHAMIRGAPEWLDAAARDEQHRTLEREIAERRVALALLDAERP